MSREPFYHQHCALDKVGCIHRNIVYVMTFLGVLFRLVEQAPLITDYGFIGVLEIDADTVCVAVNVYFFRQKSEQRTEAPRRDDLITLSAAISFMHGTVIVH